MIQAPLSDNLIVKSIKDKSLNDSKSNKNVETIDSSDKPAV